jgi:hypothetical protein
MPIHAAPVPAGPEQGPGDYGRSWYGTPLASTPGNDHDPAPGLYPPSAAEGYPAGVYGAVEDPAAAYSGSLYDQSAYQPADAPGGQQDQNGYGTPDSGYGAGTYGSYPGY